MLALLRQLLGWLHEQIDLSPDLRHLDDGVMRWHFGDDPGEGVDFGSEE